MEKLNIQRTKPIRDILDQLAKSFTSEETTLLAPQELSPIEGNLDREKALHLLRRVSFHPTEEEVEHYTGMPISVAVESLIGDGLDFLPENSSRLPNPNEDERLRGWYGQAIQNPKTAGALSLRFQLEGILNSRYRDTVDWIIDLAVNENLINNSASEKFTYFLSTIWNIEFTYDTREFNPPNLLIKNNQTLRKYRFGNYKDIAKEMTLDGAFLLYQSLQLSNKEAPNENYARELLELFTMGIGHYTEGNIREASRILTGWRTAPFFNSRKPNGEFNTWFDPDAHDTDSKQFMGTIFPKINESENNEFKVRDEEIFKLIDVIFNARAEAIAKFIAGKILRFFVYANESEEDEVLLDSIAQVLLDNDFNLKETYLALFKSQQFYDEKYLGTQIKSPFELIAGTQRILGVAVSDARRRSFMSQAEQNIYDPPNVSGWTQYRTWISTTTYPHRIDLLTDVVDDISNEEVFAVVQKFSNWQNPDAFFRELITFLVPKNFIEKRETDIVDGIIFNSSTNSQFVKSNWINLVNEKNVEMGNRLKEVFIRLVTSPDYQLT